MSPNTEAILAATDQSSPHPQSQQQHPKLKKLASKPLKLAASTFKPLSLSRTASPGLPHSNTPNTNSTPNSTAASSTTIVPETASAYSAAPTATGGGRRLGRRRKHHHVNAMGLTPAQIASAAKGPRKPLEGEEPAGWLRVRVLKAEGLVAKDRNGSSDPFVSLVVPPSPRQSTPVIKRSLNPVFPKDSSTFDFPLYLSLAGVVGGRGLEGVVWDKDLMRKEYMGEIAVPLLDWFEGGDVKLWDEALPLLTRRLLSTRRRHQVSGTVSLQMGFLPPKDVADREDALKRVKRVYGAFAEQAGVGRGIAGLLGVPAHEGIGTIKIKSTGQTQPIPFAPDQSGAEEHSAMALLQSATAAVVSPFSGGHKMQPVPGNIPPGQDDEDDESDSALEDDGLSTSSEDEFEDAVANEDDIVHVEDSPTTLEDLNHEMYNATIGVPGPKPSDMDRVPKTAGLLAPSATKHVPPFRQSSLPGYFEKQESATESGVSTPGTPYTPSGMVTPGGTKTKRPIFKRNKSRTPSTPSKKSTRDFNFDANQGREVLGIVIMEIKSASDLPKLKNSLRVSFDMDPFTVVSFGKKVFRTRVIRHSLNPTWDEKLLFHVRRHEASFITQFTVLDWDKVSGNDMIGTCYLPLSELVAAAPKPDSQTGLYANGEDGKHEMKEFTIPLVVDKEQPWESKFSPKLTVRAKYEPYDAVRQRFWRQYMTQYDADDTGTMSYTELSAMLDSLGSTLTKRTLEGYFTSCGKNPTGDELTVEEAVQCLEAEVTKDRSQKEKVSHKGDELGLTTGAVTPQVAPQPSQDGIDMIAPQGNISSPVDAQELAEQIIKSKPREQQHGEDPDSSRPGNQRLAAVSNDHVPAVKVGRYPSTIEEMTTAAPDGEASGSYTPTSLSSEPELDDVEGDISSSPDDRERVINIRTCPLCHRRRLGKRSEQDIITHLAVCASADWSRVDRIVTANYVTSSQAQRKFFTKLVNKVAIGAYSLGANSANILVQDRRTGQLQEEKMAVYVRLGIRVLYKGAKSRMEGARARKLLKSLSIKQGIKYDSPASALDIPNFIAFHNLPVDEILDPLDSFKSFNEFFYRKLRADARPVDELGNEKRMVSSADCRMMAFETVQEATSIWIKGREFTVGRLLGPNYNDVADRYEGGALGIFRLAPQDYHRFHSPVKGRIGKMTMIDGEYYTVNPQAVRTKLDVYGENVRKVVPIQTEEFGLVMTVWVGAMMVGSILTTVEEGQEVERAEELGYFAFGGSTIVCLFEKGALEWDEDLLQNGRASIETLVRMGMGLGRSTR